MNEAVRGIVDAIESVLRPVGFARRRATWNRRTEALIDVVDLQVSKAGHDVTLNCGVFDPIVHVKAWTTDVPRTVQEPQCAVRARVGDLRGGRDWWRLAESQQAATELSSLVRTTVLPFFDQMRDPNAFDEYLALKVEGKRYPDLATQLYRAIRMSERGDYDSARELLQALRQTTWRERADEVATRLFGIHSD
jgi:hypothetical protein